MADPRSQAPLSSAQPGVLSEEESGEDAPRQPWSPLRHRQKGTQFCRPQRSVSWDQGGDTGGVSHELPVWEPRSTGSRQTPSPGPGAGAPSLASRSTATAFQGRSKTTRAHTDSFLNYTTIIDKVIG